MHRSGRRLTNRMIEENKAAGKSENSRRFASDTPNKRMKPSLVADEMFPEGAGPYMDIEEVCMQVCRVFLGHSAPVTYYRPPKRFFDLMFGRQHLTSGWLKC